MTDVTQITQMAVAAAGAVDGDARAWLQRVNEMTPRIAALFRAAPSDSEDATSPQVTARKVLESSAFTAEYLGHELDDHTKRLTVSVKSATANASDQESDGSETLRTEPLWTPAGRVMKHTLDQLVPGQRVVAYKYIESIPGNKKVRVLVHLEPLGKPRQAHTTPSAVGPPSEVRETHPAPAPHDPTEGVVHGRFNQLSNRQKIAFRDACVADGIMDFMNPTDEQLDRVLVHLAAAGG